ncbi:hypothetical protein AGIG_G13704 [Arapaima gigas]
MFHARSDLDLRCAGGPSASARGFAIIQEVIAARRKAWQCDLSSQMDTQRVGCRPSQSSRQCRQGRGISGSLQTAF